MALAEQLQRLTKENEDWRARFAENDKELREFRSLYGEPALRKIEGLERQLYESKEQNIKIREDAANKADGLRNELDLLRTELDNLRTSQATKKQVGFSLCVILFC